MNKTADINVKNSGSLSGNSTLFNYYFDKPGEYEITITYVLNNVLGNKITNTEIYYINYQNTSLTTAN
ncbi:hypothetical protein IKS57_06050 [bacterium]|nr:hypothetical protein [bacterium]